MNGKIFLISLDGVRLITENNLKEKNLDFNEVFDLGSVENSLKVFVPDAVILQVNDISDVVIYKLREALKRAALNIPWLCLVMNNSSFSERMARSNRVFYYGVGVEDLGFVLDAANDAVRAGKQSKLEEKFLRQHIAK